LSDKLPGGSSRALLGFVECVSCIIAEEQLRLCEAISVLASFWGAGLLQDLDNIVLLIFTG
jgi:hypothetical protein